MPPEKGGRPLTGTGVGLIGLLIASHGVAQTQAVSALGRLEPEHGIIRIAAPSTPQSVSGPVIKELLVDEGDDVVEGQLLAVTDTAGVMEAMVAEVTAELELARREAESAVSQANEACVDAEVSRREAERRADLLSKGLAAKEEAELTRGAADAKEAACEAARTSVGAAKAGVKVAEAKVNRFKVDLERSYVRAPMPGRVLEVLARPGELTDGGAILELGRVDRMYAIAEVYETDVRLVEVGQNATVTSDALDQPVTGTVDRIRDKVQKQDEIGTDPAARKDARIVEVEILLDEPERAASLTNLQVEIVIGR
ncbi:MAG: efflux RND transporter periplasmic adaptor subunit [Xanthomonadales bacterium]|nr:efflux RND transporter periplasmic adaptor subunit [Xanthomonadales bacterium]